MHPLWVQYISGSTPGSGKGFRGGFGGIVDAFLQFCKKKTLFFTKFALSFCNRMTALPYTHWRSAALL